MAETKTTYCRICEATCGLVATVENGRVVSLAPDPEHVASRGYACKKGLAQHRVLHSPDRLLHPQKRIGDRWQRISWEQALEEIGAKVKSLVAAHGGDSVSFYLGNPISQPVRDRGLLVQYFDGGVLMQESDGSIVLAPLGREKAAEIGIDTTPVDGSGLPTFDESMFYEIGNPNPQGDPAATGKKWIEVSLSQQQLWAYQGSTLVSTSLVSTGIEPNHTEQGWFHVRYKLEKTDMQGITDANGQVIALGEQEDNSGGTPYDVKDVPHVMYFDYDAEALHGAYWHNNFGTPMSHGCVNLPLDFATWLFDWAPLGTVVWVHA